MRNKLLKITMTILVAGMCTACGNSANSLYKQSIELEKEGKYEEALQSVQKAIEKHSEKAEYYLKEGTMLTVLERYEEARTAFQKAIVDKDLELTRKNNKQAYRGIGITYYREKNFSEAEQYFVKALEEPLLPEWNTDLTRYLADTYLCEQKYKEAFPLCETLVTEYPDNVECQLQYAEVLYLLGRYEDSITAYDKVISLQSSEYSGYFGKYNALSALSRDAEKQGLLLQMEQLRNPTAEEAYFIAKAWYESGEYEKALLKLSDSLSYGYEDVHYYMAEIYKMQGNFSEAIYHLEQYIQGAGREDSASYNQLAICYLEQENYVDALSAIHSGLNVKKVEYEQQLLRNEIVILERSGAYEEALNSAIAYVENYPEDTEIKKEIEFLKTRIRHDTVPIN